MVRSKGQISLNFGSHVNFKDFFIPNCVCVCSKKKKIENILNRIFILLLGSCPRGESWGCWGGVKNLSVVICDGAPSTARSSLLLLFSNMYSGAMGLFVFCRKQTATYTVGW